MRSMGVTSQATRRRGLRWRRRGCLGTCRSRSTASPAWGNTAARYNGVGIPMTIARFLRMSAHLQLMPVLESGEETLVGGQAVMEGVMMRAPHSYCVAVRKPSGEIVTEEQAIERVSEKYPWFKLPVLRGLGMLGQAMTLGYRA